MYRNKLVHALTFSDKNKYLRNIDFTKSHHFEKQGNTSPSSFKVTLKVK